MAMNVVHTLAARVSRNGRARAAQRRRRRIVQGLLSVASHCVVSDRTLRCDVLLRERALSMHGELVQLAAAIDTAAVCPECALEILEDLLTDGCGSPLYNPRTPEAELSTTLERARMALRGDPSQPFCYPNPTSQGGPACR